jgi:5-methylcytosine-specific restriction endonuclease McrA
MLESTLIINTLKLPKWGVKNKSLIERIVEETGWKRPCKQGRRDFFLRYLKHLQDSGVVIDWTGYATKRIVPDTTKPFYKSKEWVAARYQALKKSMGRCACCGATAASSGEPLHVDHIKPKSRFPHLALEVSNLQVLCAACNIGKSNIDDTDWRQIA